MNVVSIGNNHDRTGSSYDMSEQEWFNKIWTVRFKPLLLSYPPFILALLLAFCLALPGVLWAADKHPFDKVVDHPEIAIFDEQGENVLDSGKPYSPKKTCGTCHDYDSITHAYHFEVGRDEANDEFGALRGMDQLTSPGYFGGYNCMGGNSSTWLAKKENQSESDFADYGAPGMVAGCAGCHSGGGWMEKDRNGNRYDEVDPSKVKLLDGDYFNRGTDTNNQKISSSEIHQWDWKKSGVVENDCFMCHTDFGQLQDYNADQPYGSRKPLSLYTSGLRRSALMNMGFYRYASTAVLQYIDLDGSEEGVAEKPLVDFNWDTETGELALDSTGQPLLTWNRDVFNESGKVVIPMLRFPGNDNCMMCHRTSNSRRGFYGFGESAEAVFDEDGILEEDYQDDVHKGKTWVADNGEERQIENCNSCHSRAYFRPVGSNTDLDADHNFLKGNSDMDVRNDLDNGPNATTCSYCHDEAKNPVIPSGQADMLSAHRELWKNNGDMKGYLASNLDKVTQTHLDVVSCQACHITNKKSRGVPIKTLYRYRNDSDNKLRITPYNAKPRYVWQDETSGHVLSRTERNSVFEQIDPQDCSKGGRIVDPVTKQEVATVTARVSHGSCRYGDPQSYDEYVGLKKAYDGLLSSAGYKESNTVLIWGEMNNYVISHNTRPSPQALQCGECHNQKDEGVFSALISEEGVLGSTNSKVVMELPDRRLVDEGIIQMAQPYMKMQEQTQEDGSTKYVISQNVRDILGHTKFDGSMTVLGADRAIVAAGEMKKASLSEAVDGTNIETTHQSTLASRLKSDKVFYYRANYGEPRVREIAVMLQANDQSERVYPSYRVKALYNENGLEKAKQSGLKNFASDVLALTFLNSNSQVVDTPANEPMVVRLPYLQQNTDKERISIGYSANGESWNELSAAEIIAVEPKTENSNGYVLAEVDRLGHFVVMDQALSARSSTDSGTAQPSSSGKSGGAIIYLLPLLLGVSLLRRK